MSQMVCTYDKLLRFTFAKLHKKKRKIGKYSIEERVRDEQVMA